MKDNLPIKDKSSLFVHFYSFTKRLGYTVILSLTAVSFTHISKVSVNISRNTKAVVGQ